MSDGVHDNLDPEFLGLAPSDVGLSISSWSEEVRREEEGIGGVG